MKRRLGGIDFWCGFLAGAAGIWVAIPLPR